MKTLRFLIAVLALTGFSAPSFAGMALEEMTGSKARTCSSADATSSAIEAEKVGELLETGTETKPVELEFEPEPNAKESE